MVAPARGLARAHEDLPRTSFIQWPPSFEGQRDEAVGRVAEGARAWLVRFVLLHAGCRSSDDAARPIDAPRSIDPPPVQEAVSSRGSLWMEPWIGGGRLRSSCVPQRS